jgi:hypothetical protein
MSTFSKLNFSLDYATFMKGSTCPLSLILLLRYFWGFGKEGGNASVRSSTTSSCSTHRLLRDLLPLAFQAAGGFQATQTTCCMILGYVAQSAALAHTPGTLSVYAPIAFLESYATAHNLSPRHGSFRRDGWQYPKPPLKSRKTGHWSVSY